MLKRRLLVCMGLPFLFVLSGCGSMTPGADELKQDLTENNWQNDLYVQTIENVETFQVLPYEITALSITKRDTIDKNDTIWFEFTADNTAVEVSGTGTASYYLYTEGGWQLEGFTVDTQTSKPIAPPSTADCILGWNPSWAWYDMDSDAAEMAVADCNLNAEPPTATVIYGTDKLTDGDISFLSGAFQLQYEFYDNLGWQAVGFAAAEDEEGIHATLSFSEDIRGEHQGPDGYFIIDDCSGDGTVSGRFRYYYTYTDIPFTVSSCICYDETGVYLEVYLDTTSPWYVEGQPAQYKLTVTGSDWWHTTG